MPDVRGGLVVGGRYLCSHAACTLGLVVLGWVGLGFGVVGC